MHSKAPNLHPQCHDSKKKNNPSWENNESKKEKQLWHNFLIISGIMNFKKVLIEVEVQQEAGDMGEC